MRYCFVEDVSKGPYSYRPKVFQVPVEPVDLVPSIAALIMLDMKRVREGVGEKSYSKVCFVCCSICKVVWK